MKGHRQKPTRSALAILEESYHILRELPASIWLPYLIGVIPFLGLTVWYLNMSTLPWVNPEERVGMSWLISLAFVWYQVFMGIFSRKIMVLVKGGDGEAEPPDRSRKVFLALRSCGNFLLQSILLVLTPLMWLTGFAFLWSGALSHNHSILSYTDSDRKFLPLLRRSWSLSQSWLGHHIQLVSWCCGVWVSVFLGIYLSVITGSSLLDSVFGIETPLVKDKMLWVSVTVLVPCCALTYLIVQPFVRCVYILRLYYLESATSGADLISEYKQIVSGKRNRSGNPRKGRPAAILLMLFVFLYGSEIFVSVDAQANGGTEDQEFRDNLRQVLSQNKYTWKYSPERKAIELPDNHILSRFGRWFAEGFERLIRWLFKRKQSSSTSGQDISSMMEGATYLIAGVVLVIVIAILMRAISANRRKPRHVSLQPVDINPVDLENPDVSADSLPGDEWMALAEELISKGDFRKALRALYFSGLSSLAQSEFIFLAKYKTNRDYHREIVKKGHVDGELPVRFQSVVRIFEMTWYGYNRVSPELVSNFSDEVKDIRVRCRNISSGHEPGKA